MFGECSCWAIFTLTLESRTSFLPSSLNPDNNLQPTYLPKEDNPGAVPSPSSTLMLLCGLDGAQAAGGGELHLMTHFLRLSEEDSTLSPSHQW